MTVMHEESDRYFSLEVNGQLTGWHARRRDVGVLAQFHLAVGGSSTMLMC